MFSWGLSKNELYKSLIYCNSPFINMINFIKVFFCAVIIHFSQPPGKIIRGRFAVNEASEIICAKKVIVTSGISKQRFEAPYSNGGDGSREVKEPFCFYCGLEVDWILQVPWIKHLAPIEEASWLEGQLANCSKRLKWHPIKRSVQNRYSLIEKAAGAR